MALSYEIRHNKFARSRRATGGLPVGMIQTLFTADDGPSIANSAAEVNIFPFNNNLGSRVITNGMASFLKCFYLRIWGRIATTGLPALDIRIYLGGVQRFSLGGVLAASTSGSWILDAPMFVRTPGAGGTITLNNGRFYYSANGDTQQFAQSAATAIDWTTNPTLQVSFQFGTADPLNQLFFDSAILEYI